MSENNVPMTFDELLEAARKSEGSIFIDAISVHNLMTNCVNRDEFGNPKTTTLDGKLRGRVSSQALKRAVRDDKIFQRVVNMICESTQTQGVPDLLLKEALKHELKHAETIVPVVVEKAIGPVDKPKKKGGPVKKTRGTLLLGLDEVQKIADLMIGAWGELMVALEKDEQRLAEKAKKAEKAEKAEKVKEGKKSKAKAEKSDDFRPSLTYIEVGKVAEKILKSFKGGTRAPNVHLFGRMITERPSMNVDGACCFAHAISIAPIIYQSDSFTAIDELARSQGDPNYTSMLGSAGFDSSSFYRFACVDVSALAKVFTKDELEPILRVLLSLMVRALPEGKKRAYASFTSPSFSMFVVRRDYPRSLSTAFEGTLKPAKGRSMQDEAVRALDAEFASVQRRMPGAAAATVSIAVDCDPKHVDCLNHLAPHQVGGIDEAVEVVTKAALRLT